MPYQNHKPSQTYEEFVEKFKHKKTTDDCYTPPEVYDAVADWTANRYGLDRADFVRPFYPGGDYERFEYAEGCVVVDNPPFSIIKKITDFYLDNGIRFFLFVPATVLINRTRTDVTRIATCCRIEYTNGARVPTNFMTNLEPGGVVLMSAPTLYKAVMRNGTKTAKHYYPAEVCTVAAVEHLSLAGEEFRLRADDCMQVNGLDFQSKLKKEIYGGGYLLSEKAAAEKAAAEKAAAAKAPVYRWELSDREMEIVKNLGDKK